MVNRTESVCLASGHIRLLALYSNVTKLDTYVQSESQVFGESQSRFRLDEQGREGKRQENDPANDCNYRNKQKKTVLL